MELMTIVMVAFVLAVLIIVFLIKLGYYSLNVEVDVNRQCVYYWYRGNIIESFKFSLDTDVDTLREEKEKHLQLAQAKIEKIKKLKNQLWEE